jgi:hypothetical protein
VVLRYGTAYNGLEADPVILETAVRALVEGHALRETTRSLQAALGGLPPSHCPAVLTGTLCL